MGKAAAGGGERSTTKRHGKSRAFFRNRLMGAAPVRGVGCIHLVDLEPWEKSGCRPREGCGLHPLFPTVLFGSTGCRPREGCGLHHYVQGDNTGGIYVAVPVRGVGCISKSIQPM